MAPEPTPHPRHAQGFTVLELIITILVLAILVTVGIPSFTALLERHRLKGAVETLYTELQLARSVALRQNRPCYVDFNPGADWCYGLDDTAACDCASAGDCQVDGVEKVVRATEYRGITLTSTTFTGDGTGFNARNGTALGAGEALFQGPQGTTAKVVLSALGRARICSDAAILGYPSC
jgi:type IV fimbrial biogenesis protein FimT